MKGRWSRDEVFWRIFSWELLLGKSPSAKGRVGRSGGVVECRFSTTKR